MYKNTEEDLSVYKDCFIDLLLDDTPKIIKIVNNYFSTILFNWINNHGQCMKSPKSEQDKKDTENPFNQDSASGTKKPMSMKKRQTIMISQIKDENSDEVKSNQRPNIFITDESSQELVFTDLLENIMIFVQNVSELEGNWREHQKLLQNIEETVHLFYLPEIQN